MSKTQAFTSERCQTVNNVRNVRCTQRQCTGPPRVCTYGCSITVWYSSGQTVRNGHNCRWYQRCTTGVRCRCLLRSRRQNAGFYVRMTITYRSTQRRWSYGVYSRSVRQGVQGPGTVHRRSVRQGVQGRCTAGPSVYGGTRTVYGSSVGVRRVYRTVYGRSVGGP